MTQKRSSLKWMGVALTAAMAVLIIGYGNIIMFGSAISGIWGG